MGPRTALWVVGLGLVLLPGPVGPAEAAAQVDSLQQQIAASQRRLEEIRAERERLQREMDSARSRAEPDGGAKVAPVMRSVRDQ